MTIALAAIVKDEAETLPRSLPTMRGLIDSWVILDTGSTDNTAEVIHELLDGIPGQIHRTEWTNYGDCRNQLLELARGSAEWMLTIDADMEVEFHEDLCEWLSGDPDPAVDAWMVDIVEADTAWQRPCLIRSSYPWRYVDAVHEYLDTSEAYWRPLLGLKLLHFGHAETPAGKWEQYLELLRPGADAGDPRAVFYFAETLRTMGRTAEAIDEYERRASMNSWEEEAWYATYMAARLRKSIPLLLAAHERRPWRPEPLRWAARFAASDERWQRDVLFKELT